MIDSLLKKANILIVDDQEANIDVLEGFLEMQGYSNLKTTTDPREVFSLLDSFRPDLILLDLSMPHMNGFEVMERLKEIVPEHTYLPILVLTADITKEAKIRALSDGASDFLTKPFDLLEVGLRIKNLLHTSYLQQQLQNHNQILDEKVKQRTRELQQKNQELTLAKEKAEAGDRLKTSFINNISHEIRTPLNGIMGFAQILTDPTLSEEEKRDYLNILNESSERLINTVMNFMEISMISSGNQEVNNKDFTLSKFIYTVADHFRIRCEDKKLALIPEIPAGAEEIRLFTDKELLFKIFRNLMDNAIRFTTRGSVTLGFEVTEEEVVFFVRDTGKGISDEHKQSIFKSFMQEDNSYTRDYEGCGLGLSIATGLIELLGGKIWLDSEKGTGSTFYFSLPNSQVIIQPLVVRQEQNKKAVKTILVAEDDEINFIYTNVLIKGSTTKVLHAWNGEEAVRMSKENPDIFAVLLDLKMPVMDGFEAARQIREFRRELPILAVTAFSGGDERQRAKEAGCDEFITKPIQKEILMEKLARHGILIAQ